MPAPNVQNIDAEDKAYMDYLDELFETTPSFGLLLYKGDPIAFEHGKSEWLDSLTHQDKANLGLIDTEEE